MASRRDQLHSYQFMIQRVVAALVMRETDPAQSPFRRAAGAIFAGVMVAAIGVAGFIVYGLWKPGGNDEWIEIGEKKPVALVEKETGAKYLYSDGTLFPVFNYTSLRLVVGANKGDPEPIAVSRNSIAGKGFTMGPMIGIPDAPPSLPDKDSLVTGEWYVCTQPRIINASGKEDGLETLLVIGRQPSERRALGSASVLLVKDEATTDKYLIYRGYKHKIIDEDLVLSALTWNSRTPLEVGSAWLSALPDGDEIVKPAVEGEGEPSDALADATIGDVYQVTGVGDHPYFVALKDRLAEITEMQAAIQMASRDQGEPHKIIASNTGTPSRELWPSGKNAPPESANPGLEEPDPSRATCGIFGIGDKPPQVVFDTKLGVGWDQGAPTVERGEDGEMLASRVVVANGMGAIVLTSRERGQGPEILCLVTDNGKCNTVPSYDVLKMLGYDVEGDEEMKGKIGWMPENVVGRLGRGPALDPQAAMGPAYLVMKG